MSAANLCPALISNMQCNSFRDLHFICSYINATLPDQTAAVQQRAKQGNSLLSECGGSYYEVGGGGVAEKWKVPEERCRPTILREALSCVQNAGHPCYNMSAAREASEAHIWNAAKELQLRTRATAPFIPHGFGRIRSLFPHPGFIYIYLYSWFREETL